MKDFNRWLLKRRIGVLMGGLSAERSISLKTGSAILKSLKRQGFKAFAIDARKPLPESLKKNKIDFAYVALHGPGGEDGCVQGLLEWLKIPYTGSRVLASALAMDKAVCKRMFDSVKLPTAKWYALHKPRPLPKEAMTSAAHPPSCEGGMESRLGYPVVVKPARQGSAVGVSIVKTAKEWPIALMGAF